MVEFMKWGNPPNTGYHFETAAGWRGGGLWYPFMKYVTTIQGLHYNYRKSIALGLKLVYSFISFIILLILLPVTYVRHSWCNAKDWQSVDLREHRQKTFVTLSGFWPLSKEVGGGGVSWVNPLNKKDSWRKYFFQIMLNLVKELAAVSYLQNLEIRWKKGMYISFDFIWYSIHLVIVH